MLYLELADVFIHLFQTAIDAFYNMISGHKEDVHESVPMEETHPSSRGPAIAGTIHPLKTNGKSVSQQHQLHDIMRFLLWTWCTYNYHECLYSSFSIMQVYIHAHISVNTHIRSSSLSLSQFRYPLFLHS